MAGYGYGFAGVAAGAGAGYYPPAAFPPAAPVGPTSTPVFPTPCPPGYGYGSGKAHNNSGTQRMEGDLKQDGTFKGHGTGAKIIGGFDATGDIS